MYNRRVVSVLAVVMLGISACGSPAAQLTPTTGVTPISTIVNEPSVTVSMTSTPLQTSTPEAKQISEVPTPTPKVQPTTTLPAVPLKADVKLRVLTSRDTSADLLVGTITSERDAYVTGEPILLSLNLKSVATEPITLAVPIKIALVHMRPSIGERIDGRVAIAETKEIQPGQDLKSVAYFSEGANSSPIPFGRYGVSIYGEFKYQGNLLRLDTTNSGTLFITPTQGALELVLIPQEKRTHNNINATVREVFFSHKGIVIEALLVSPDYNPQLLGIPGPDFADAIYSIDGDSFKPAGSGNSGRREDGVSFSWTLDPIASDAKELRFSIISYQRQHGQWEWTFDLRIR